MEPLGNKSECFTCFVSLQQAKTKFHSTQKDYDAIHLFQFCFNSVFLILQNIFYLKETKASQCQATSKHAK